MSSTGEYGIKKEWFSLELAKEGNQQPGIPYMGEYVFNKVDSHLNSSKTWGYMAEDMTSR